MPASLGAFCETYIGNRANLKPNTKRNYETTRKLLVDHFGEDRLLFEISAGDADDWREAMLKRLSLATVSREVKRARQEWHLNFPKCLPRNWYGQKWPRLP